MIPCGLEEAVKSPNRFDEDFGDATPIQRRKIIQILREFMVEVRAVLGSTGRMARLTRPSVESQCATCAFNPVLDDARGFPATAYGLLSAIYRDQIFICHSGQSGWKKCLIDPKSVTICSGFESVRLFSGTRSALAAAKAMRAIREVVPKKT